MALGRVAASGRARSRRGFTLVEALVSTAIMSIAGTALLLGVSSTLLTTETVLDTTIAQGMAQQLMDEVAGAMYQEPGSSPRLVLLSPEASEVNGSSRQKFDDMDDYHGFSSTPVDRFGVPLGTGDGQGGLRHPNFRVRSGYFDRWRASVQVYYVSATDLTSRLPAGETSNYRAVHVLVERVLPNQGPRKLAELYRVFCYVPHA